MSLSIDRITIDDVGGDPIRLAMSITSQVPDLSKAVPVREIAQAIDILEIREEEIRNFEGGLVVPLDRSTGSIIVRRDRHENRKRFTIAHEIGHYVNPFHTPPSSAGFRCSSQNFAIESFSANDRLAKMEVQANQFAAELLMPASEVDRLFRGMVAVDLEHVLTMADRFSVSREAAARRYVARVGDPAAIIFSKDNVIRYVKTNSDFPRLSVWNGHPLPNDCLSHHNESPTGEVSECVEVHGHVWLERSRGWTLYQQVLNQQNRFRMTLLTVERDGDDGEEWEQPSFRR